jgi:hypothetical protein
LPSGNQKRLWRDPGARVSRTIWIVEAHRDGKRFVVRADEKLTAFVELELAIRAETPEDCGAREIKLDELSRIQ